MEEKKIDIKLSNDRKIALKIFEDFSGLLFFTGIGGTGKSYLMNYWKNNTKRNIISLGSTGTASIEIGGVTAHSFFGIKAIPFPEEGRMTENNYKVLQIADTIIIDEGPCLRADVIDCIDRTLKKYLYNKLPFGGKRIILMGDVLQTSPIVKNTEIKFFNGKANLYNSPYFFDSNVFNDPKLKISCIELLVPNRTKEIDFLNTQMNLRNGFLTDSDLLLLNSRVTEIEKVPNNAIKIFLTNKLVEEENNKKLSELPGDYIRLIGKIEGEYKETEALVPLELNVKIGAKVLSKINQGDFLRNGTLCIIKSFNEPKQEITLEIVKNKQIVTVSKHSWDKYKLTVNKNGEIEKEVIGTYTQFPIKLGYSTTAHSVQGQTLEECVISFSGGVFAHGQSYVAISRAVSLNKLYLLHPINKTHALAHPKALEFMKKIRSGDYSYMYSPQNSNSSNGVLKNLLQIKLNGENPEDKIIHFYDSQISKIIEDLINNKFPDIENISELDKGYMSKDKIVYRFPKGFMICSHNGIIYGLKYNLDTSKWNILNHSSNTALINKLNKNLLDGYELFVNELS